MNDWFLVIMMSKDNTCPATEDKKLAPRQGERYHA